MTTSARHGCGVATCPFEIPILRLRKPKRILRCDHHFYSLVRIPTLRNILTHELVDTKYHSSFFTGTIFSLSFSSPFPREREELVHYALRTTLIINQSTISTNEFFDTSFFHLYIFSTQFDFDLSLFDSPIPRILRTFFLRTSFRNVWYSLLGGDLIRHLCWI